MRIIVFHASPATAGILLLNSRFVQLHFLSHSSSAMKWHVRWRVHRTFILAIWWNEFRPDMTFTAELRHVSRINQSLAGFELEAKKFQVPLPLRISLMWGGLGQRYLGVRLVGEPRFNSPLNGSFPSKGVVDGLCLVNLRLTVNDISSLPSW